MKKRIPAVLLAVSLALSTLPPAWSAETGGAAAGSVQATVRIDYVQELAELQERDIQAELFQGRNSLGKISLTKAASKRLGGYSAAVSLRDRLGGELTGSALPGALDLSVDGLPQGNYTLRVTGEGYTACDAPFSIGSYHKYIEVGTGDATFTLGDVDGNGRVDAKDRDALSNALGSTARGDLARYDLNGDGEINIVDLAYVNHNVSAPSTQSTVLDTTCIGVQLDAAQAAADLTVGGTVIRSGRMESLLLEDGSVTTFQNPSGDIRIPVPLSKAVQAEHLQIVTPDTASGAILEGMVEVEYNGGTVARSFSADNTMYPGTHAITRTPGTNVITIPLGRRVAVKKITITVTKTAGGQYAAMESIRFLQDIVPEELVEPNSQVKNLSASAGDGLVNLTWSQLPNVSGYRVEYWQEGRESARRSLNADIPRAQVTGLSNLKTYYFTVTPVDGSWQGRTCAPVEAVPQPAKAPAAPDMVNITPLDGQLAVSWKQGENATWYEVYYTDAANASTSSYRQTGGRVTGTRLTISGLTNGTPYYIYVVAGNDVGRSGPSRIYTGTPAATDYSRPEGIPTEGILDSANIKSIALADPSNYSASEYPNGSFNIRNVIDNDFRTHWTAKDWYHNEHVEVVFTRPVDLYGAIWTPRLDGAYPGNLRAYSVRVWYQGEELNGEGHLLTGGVDDGNVGNSSNAMSWPEIPNRGTMAASKFAILPFEPVTDVAKISVAVEQRDYNTVSLSELMFLEYDPERCLPDNISQLFDDELHTQLAGGVTQARIDELKARMNSEERNYYLNPQTLDDELALAQELLTGSATKGVVLRGIQSRSSAADSKTYQQGGSDLQPLGVAAKAGQEITVYASGIPEGETVSVYATQFNAEVSAWRAEMGTLVNGRNILTVPSIDSQNTGHGGSLYLTYSGTQPQNIQLHVRRAVDIPVLELSDWYSLSDGVRRERIGAYVDELSAYVSAQGINNSNAQINCLNVTELSMPTVLLSIPAAAVLNANGQNRDSKVENLYQNVQAWEELMHICKTTQGIDKTYAGNDMTSRQNIRCMKMFAGAFMYAAGSHIGIGYGSCGGMVSGQPVAKLDAGATANHLFGWGIAHEIGHNMDKLGRAEITNNLYSLMVQTYDGGENTFTSRLEAGGKYPAIFTKTAQGWPGESNDVFVQLGMYWQLHLAYDSGTEPMDFYNRFFKAWKAGAYTKDFTGLSYDERVALTACGVADKDLTEFFERWGMTLSDRAKKKLETYGKESRAIWYLSDQSRRDRLSAAVPARGSLTAQAKLDGENKVVVTITPSISGSVQGYEIVRNGQPIAFVLPGADNTAVYEDVIGSGNHRTYQYQVIAYDTLGHRITQLVNDGVTEAGTVRVAYDKTVDPDSYTMTREGTTVTVRFQEGTSISGLKLTGADRPKTGDYTVQVEASFTTGEGKDQKQVEKTVTARTGSFDKGNQAVDDTDCYLTYFQKPGAAADDSRIWTYDAKTVTITGVPAEVKNGDIHLVSYAGDDVAFLEGGAVGRLSADYRYGSGAEDVVAKGTLVIVGTYRGDPRFNTVKVEGRFSKTTAEDGAETVYEDRWLDGYTLMFAEIPEDKQVSDISDGLFIFVPDVQKEAELQEVTHCDGVNLLPSQMRAVLSRTDVPDSAGSQHVTAETLWVGTPGGADLPTIVLEGGNG